MNELTETRTDSPDAAKAAPSRPETVLLPPVDVIEDASGITLYADLPGVPKDRVQVRVDGDQLLIEGDIVLNLAQGVEPTHAEVPRSRYQRAFTLSNELDSEKMSAEMNQGELRLRIPKAAHAQPRKVQVRVN